MAFNIQEMISNINQYGGVARTSHFDVFIPNAELMSNKINGVDLNMFAETVSLPGVSVQTSEITHSGYGLIEKRPYQTQFLDVDIGFIVDASARSLLFFHDWISKISKYQTVNVSDDDMFKFEYPENYQLNVLITQYDSSGLVINNYTLLKAYPTTVTPIQMSWANQNEIARFNVSFAYNSWSTELNQ